MKLLTFISLFSTALVCEKDPEPGENPRIAFTHLASYLRFTLQKPPQRAILNIHNRASCEAILMGLNFGRC